MSSHIPISLRGNNLGERHRYLNNLVSDAYIVEEPFENIIALPESSPVDRLFKIDLASKCKHVEYILSNLQDDDMLYVSRALKSKWLLNESYSNIINPKYLENVLYPEMITTAVNKMKHWILLNLRDPKRCQEFYEYYSEEDINLAMKFFCKCSNEFIVDEFPKEIILAKITPHYLKIICEKCPSVAKMYFDMLKKDKSVFDKYMAQKIQYFYSIKCVLNCDATMYLDIIEEHFLPHFQRLSSKMTKYIMKQYKDRFVKKAELYTARILNVVTIAKCLNPEECEELVVKLVRASYLKNWFNYKNVEPLIKRLDTKRRIMFKKKIFVEKDFGDEVLKWPYPIPDYHEEYHVSRAEIDVFHDDKEYPCAYEHLGKESNDNVKPLFVKQSLMSICNADVRSKPHCVPKTKTLLDQLFDEYRFKSFDQTLSELSKKIRLESSSQNRMYMMLVLVSKSGGKLESIEKLFKMLKMHYNEPPHVRAAIVRSLVKRAAIWRVSESIWEDLLIFGQNLGLDGKPPDAHCIEGFHAVVIRSLLMNGDCSRAIKDSFINNNFSTLIDYSLTAAEKQCVGNLLLNILLDKTNSKVKVNMAVKFMQYALDTLQAYNIKFETCPRIVANIKNLVAIDKRATESILKRLFRSKLGRKELFFENFIAIQTDASYYNALKQDISILPSEYFLTSILSGELKADVFLRKINIYFGEKNGLASRFLSTIKEGKIDMKLARPLVHLIGNDLKSYILGLDTKNVEIKRFSSEIRANAHLARPILSINAIDWYKAGAKLIANRVLKCRTVEIDYLIIQLLTWKRTAKLAINLAQRTSHEVAVFATASKIRPTIALKTALAYFRRQGEQSEHQIWEIVKLLMPKIVPSLKKSRHLFNKARQVESIPLCIRPDYATVMCVIINDIDFNSSMSILCHIYLLQPKIDGDFIQSALFDFLQNQFIIEKMYNDYDIFKITSLFLKIFGRHLLLCKREEIQTNRLKKIAQLYLFRLQSYWKSKEKKALVLKYLTIILKSLKYTEMYFNEEYVSCIPVLEFILRWMQTILPVEKYFNYHASVHLTMLYSKAIQQTMSQHPGVLADKNRRCKEGTELVGEIFGKYIGQEVQKLRKEYFDSIVELYGSCVVEYLTEYFSVGWNTLVPYIIKGILSVTNGLDSILALSLYKAARNGLTKEKDEKIRKLFKQQNHVEFDFVLNSLI